MSARDASALRLVTFGDPDGDVWGSAIEAGERALAFGTPEGTFSTGGASEVSFDEFEGGWRWAGNGFDLLVSPLGEEGGLKPSPAGDQLCRMKGSLRVGESERQVSCAAIRSLAPPPSLADVEAVRAIAGWFAEDRAVALRALRPKGSSGQDHDQLAATLFDPEHWVAVNDPRLSTTYRDEGRPDRASLELWVGEGEEQYPRRAAAEARGEAVRVSSGAMRVEITPLRCHAGGHDGAGVYLIAHL